MSKWHLDVEVDAPIRPETHTSDSNKREGWLHFARHAKQDTRDGLRETLGRKPLTGNRSRLGVKGLGLV